MTSIKTYVMYGGSETTIYCESLSNDTNPFVKSTILRFPGSTLHFNNCSTAHQYEFFAKANHDIKLLNEYGLSQK